ncbi:sulfatase [Haloplanus halobius]|uniref:sulfatase n=1 Tax=Haloplanus halobius TaxID=2934938 RepID=UPI00200BE374|nr:sulfatase [Haloplanus sp. XH21]
MTDTPVSNVLLVTVDSLRADAIEPYGGEYDTPALADLADRSTIFENAFAHGNWTPMSFPSILASRPAFADTGRIGVDGTTTLAERLQEAGVATGGFNAANGFLTEHWGYDDGFDHFEAFVGDTDGRASEFVAAHPTWGAWLQLLTSPFRRAGNFLRGGSDEKPFTDASRMLDIEREATSFIDDTDEPFFLWVHYMDAHTPYVPAPRYLRDLTDRNVGTFRMMVAHVRTGLGWSVGDRTLADLRTLYQAAVRQVDASLERLLTELDDAGVGDDTAVVLAGDHGEEFMDHGHLSHYPKLYDELVHVPLLVHVPGTEPGRVSEHVGLDAIPPTVCELLGVDPADEWTGESLLPTIRGGTAPVTDPVISVAVRGDDVTQQPIPRGLDEGDLLVSARETDWVYIQNTATGTEELYDRRADPTQQSDRSDDGDPSVVAVRDRLRAAVGDHVATLDAVEPGGAAADVDDGIETRLKALGYR